MKKNGSTTDLLDSDNGKHLKAVNEELQKEAVKAKIEYFKVGEIIVLKGRQFRVKSMKPDELRLKMIKRIIKE